MCQGILHTICQGILHRNISNCLSNNSISNCNYISSHSSSSFTCRSSNSRSSNCFTIIDWESETYFLILVCFNIRGWRTTVNPGTREPSSRTKYLFRYYSILLTYDMSLTRSGRWWRILIMSTLKCVIVSLNAIRVMIVVVLRTGQQP